MLRVTGRLMFVESNAYDFLADDGRRVAGTSHLARVDTGRARYEDVKVSEANLLQLPADASIPDEGVAVDWDVEITRQGKVAFVAPHVERVPATSTSKHNNS